jgi:gas vesicle protein
MRREHAYLAVGVGLGLAAGIVGGLLLAPESGARTRRKLADGAHQAADIARDLAYRAETGAGHLGERVEHYLGRDEELAWRKIREIREGVERYTTLEGA